jgi:hypothetical protein
MKKAINATVNGVSRTDEVEPRMLLVHYLRDVLGLTGTHVGCETSLCGACTVLLDGQAVKSCTMFCAVRRRVGSNGGRSRQKRRTASRAGRILGTSRFAVRLLHARNDHDRDTVARSQRQPVARRDLSRARRQSLSLHRVPAHYRSSPIRGEESSRFLSGGLSCQTNMSASE